MTTDHAVRKELQDLEAKVESAREVAARPNAGERDKSDLKMIEQEYVAAQQKAKHPETARHEPSDPVKKVDHKLDAALKESFPGSDPVSIEEAGPPKTAKK